MLMNANAGNYRFLPASTTFSSGTVAMTGFAIVHAVFRHPRPVAQAFADIQAHLAGVGRPMQAACGFQLRSPKPFTFDGFAEFNKGYVELLQQYQLHIDGKGPAARTNVCPEPLAIAPAEPSIYAFSYTVPTAAKEVNFVAAGAGEIKPGPFTRDSIVRLGETTPDAMREKAAFVMRLLTAAMADLGVGWQNATATNIYTVHPLESYFVSDILNPMGKTAIHGAHWFYSRPPIGEIEFEMDVRGVAQEITL